jgi:hypothetical protein
MKKNKQLTRGNKMKKAILSLLVVLSLSAALAAPSHAYWENQNGRYYWCEFGKFCR